MEQNSLTTSEGAQKEVMTQTVLWIIFPLSFSIAQVGSVLSALCQMKHVPSLLSSQLCLLTQEGGKWWVCLLPTQFLPTSFLVHGRDQCFLKACSLVQCSWCCFQEGCCENARMPYNFQKFFFVPADAWCSAFALLFICWWDATLLPDLKLMLLPWHSFIIPYKLEAHLLQWREYIRNTYMTSKHCDLRQI